MPGEKLAADPAGDQVTRFFAGGGPLGACLLVLFIKCKILKNLRLDVSLYTAGIKNLLGRELDGDGDGQPGGGFKFYHLTESLVVVPNTEITGRVFASEKLDGQHFPLQGVIGRVAGNENAQVFTGAEGALALPCPEGRFLRSWTGGRCWGKTGRSVILSGTGRGVLWS